MTIKNAARLTDEHIEFRKYTADFVKRSTVLLKTVPTSSQLISHIWLAKCLAATIVNSSANRCRTFVIEYSDMSAIYSGSKITVKL